jgi:hypothetical protein
MLLLVVVAFGPDWIDWILAARDTPDPGSALLSHSIPSVVVGAAAVALAYWLIARRRHLDAAALAALYLSHWLADFITGKKPTWSGGPMVGFLLYDHAPWDFIVEAAVIAACGWLYWRALPESGRRRRAVAFVVPAGLVAMQAAFDLVVQKSL